jgi:uncharacterized membrane protein YfcA
MALVVPLDVAIGLAILPTIVTSIWQGLTGGAISRIVSRCWTFAVPCCLMIWVGVYVLATIDRVLIVLVLGGLLCTYAVYALMRPTLPKPGKHLLWLSPVMGGVTGVAGGATGMFVMPGAPYMQLLGMKRDELVQALSLQSLLYPPMLAVALGQFDLFSMKLQVTSLALLAPTFAGLAIGSALRRRISEERFKRVFTWTLLALGIAIVGRSIANVEM